MPTTWTGKVWFMCQLTYYRWFYAGSTLMAAALGFYTLICFMPLGMFLVWVASLAFGEPRVLTELHSALATISPNAADSLVKQVADALRGANPSVTGILGGFALVWAGHRLFEILEVSLTRVWHGRPVRNFLVRKLIAFAMLIAAAAFLGGYMLSVSAVATVQRMLGEVDPKLGQVVLDFWAPLVRLIALGLVFIAFYLIYRYIPRERTPARVPLLGALVATALFYGVAEVFSRWIGRFGAYESIYGSMTNVVLFGLWAYSSAAILLVSAAISASYFQVFGLGRAGEEEGGAEGPAEGASKRASAAEGGAAAEDRAGEKSAEAGGAGGSGAAGVPFRTGGSIPGAGDGGDL